MADKQLGVLSSIFGESDDNLLFFFLLLVVIFYFCGGFDSFLGRY